MQDNFEIRGEVTLLRDDGEILLDKKNMIVKSGRLAVFNAFFKRNSSSMYSIQLGYRSSGLSIVKSTDTIVEADPGTRTEIRLDQYNTMFYDGAPADNTKPDNKEPDGIFNKAYFTDMPPCYKIKGWLSGGNGEGVNNTSTGINDVIGNPDTDNVLLNGRMRQYFNSEENGSENCSVSYYVWMKCPEGKSYKFNNLGLIAAWMDRNITNDIWVNYSGIENIKKIDNGYYIQRTVDGKTYNIWGDFVLFSRLNCEDITIEPDRKYCLKYTLYF